MSPSLCHPLHRLHSQAVTAPQKVTERLPAASHYYPPSSESTYFVVVLAKVLDRELIREAWVTSPAQELSTGVQGVGGSLTYRLRVEEGRFPKVLLLEKQNHSQALPLPRPHGPLHPLGSSR